MTTEIKIYTACLAAYNNGILHGAWIDACQDTDDIQSEIAAMLKSSPIPQAEEWAIHDHEGFEGVSLSEYAGVQRVAALASFIEEHGTLGSMLLTHFGGDIDDAQSAIDDQYAGEFQSVADFAEHITEETTDIPEALQYYIDYDAMARDLVVNDIFKIETAFDAVHIFWQR